MLTWDEEVKPSLQKSLASGLPDSRTMELPPLSSVQPEALVRSLDGGGFSTASSVSTSTAAPAATKRVKASDKRIINGQTDVNQLVIVRYSRSGST